MLVTVPSILRWFLPLATLISLCFFTAAFPTFSSVQSLSRVWLFATPWTAARQASLSIPNSRSPPKPMSIESVMPSNHLILCCPLLLLPSISPSIRVFSNKSALRIRWPKYWGFLYTNIITFEVLGTSNINTDFPPHNFMFLTLYLQPWNSFKFHLQFPTRNFCLDHALIVWLNI